MIYRSRSRTRGLLWVLGLALVPACANPCEDDGLIQSEDGACPADASAGNSETETATATATETETATNSASDSVSMTASDSANSDSASNSATDTETESASASDSETESASATASDTDSATASDTDGETTQYCEDADEDGFGDADACVDVPDGEDPPDGSVPNGDDCDDQSAQTFPGAAEHDSDTICMQDEDEDGWGDDDPADGVTPGSDCSDDGVDPCVVLITQDGTDINPYDQGLIAALELEGYVIFNFADTEVVLEDGNGVDVVVISETAQSTDIAGTMADTLAPLICLEGLVWDDMGMAAEATSTTTTNLTILAEGDPLAAGLVGDLSAITGFGSGLFYAPAPAGATIVASVAGDDEDIVEFAYQAGDAMLDGFVAPGRRIGLGFDADQGANPIVTIQPAGIALFRAALTWVTGG